jgi:glycosyltransferase involved in cell wall biosynthesis
MGYGRALRTGFGAASMEYIFFMDADGQFSIDDLGAMLPFAENHDMVIGYRQERKDPTMRVLLGTAFTGIINRYFGLDYKDINCAYKLLRRRDLERFGLRIDGPLINAEILLKAQKRSLDIKELPVPHYPRLHGQSTGARVSTIMRAFRDFFYLLSVIRGF